MKDSFKIIKLYIYVLYYLLRNIYKYIYCDAFLFIFNFLIFRSSSGVGEEDVKGGAKTPSKTQGG